MAKNETTARLTKNALAEAILAMSYGELVKVADQLADLKAHRLITREEFAALLYDWAEAQ